MSDSVKFFIEFLAAASAQMILAAAVGGLILWVLRREKEIASERIEFRAADNAEREKLIEIITATSKIAANCETVIEQNNTIMNRVYSVIEHCIRAQGRNENTHS
jgi:phage gp46-like protein